MHLNGGALKNVVSLQKSCLEQANWQNVNVHEKLLAPGGCLPLPGS